MAVKKIVKKDGAVKWEVRVYEGGRGSKRIKRLFDRRVDAESFLHEFKGELKERLENPFAQKTLTERKFREEAEYWLRDGEIRFSNGHLIRVKAVLEELYPSYGDWSLDRFTPEVLSLFQQKEKSKGLANGTVNRKTEVVTAILNFAVKHRRIPFNPSTGFRKLRNDKAEMSFWNEEEATSFLSKMNVTYPRGSEKRWVYVVYLLTLNTGLRAGEIWGLKPGDIAVDGKSLRIQRQFNRTTLDFGVTKSKKSRFVPCPLPLLEELRLLIKSQKVEKEETIFLNHKRKPICHDNFSDRQFQKDIEIWEGRQIRFHDLRHTAATLLIHRGVDIRTVKEVCGHSDIATTMNYVHMVGGSVEKLSELFIIAPGQKKEVAL